MDPERMSRQSFLGERITHLCEKTMVGIVGLGGGGSQISQQMAHLGFKNFALFDPDITEKSNLNRLIGATDWDSIWKMPKVAIAERVIHGINPDALVQPFQAKWQDHSAELVKCDIVFGCVDSLLQRDQLERIARRYLIPYVDIGMSVDTHRAPHEPPRMFGQVFISMPGDPCMRCLGFLTDDDLKLEGESYGDAGPNPQVVWANGVLASSAVGLTLGFLTGWHGRAEEIFWLSYDGNIGTLSPHIKLSFNNLQECPHYPLERVGPVTPFTL